MNDAEPNKDLLFHDSHDPFFRTPFGAVPCGEEVTIRLRVNNSDIVESAYLFLQQNENNSKNIKMELTETHNDSAVYSTKISAPSSPCLIWYYFIVTFQEETYYYCNNENELGGIGQVVKNTEHAHALPSYQITVYERGSETPNWLKDAVIYQIFVDRFHNGNEDGSILNPKKNSMIHSHWDNNPFYVRECSTGKIAHWDFFGGNLKGVRKKLPYLKSLGINTIYFNPIFESPSNHKYDVGDYHKIDPMFGENSDFKELCEEAGKMGIFIILDGVFSHTGSDSKYFNKEKKYDSLGACQSKDSPYYSWYRFYEFPDKYECWWGIENMPNVNEMESSYQDFIIYDENSVMKYWHNAGIKGWRLDVPDEIPDQFLKNFRKEMKKINSDYVLIGEVWEDASNKISYEERREYLLGEELDGVTNYPLRRIILDFLVGKIDAYSTQNNLMNIFENYPIQHFFSSWNLTGTHDVPRTLTALDEGIPENISKNERTDILNARLKLAVIWQMTSPGTTLVYYGDEAGLEGGKDPDNRAAYPWGNESEEILTWYKSLIAVRNHYDVFQTGRWISLNVHEHVYACVRVIDNEKDVFDRKRKNNAAVILLNRNLNEEIGISVDLNEWFRDSVIDVLDNYKEVFLNNGNLNITLQPLEGKVFVNDRWGDNLKTDRKSGVLLHPTSLPSPYGIGDLGSSAYEFVDFLDRTGQKLWQLLPLNPPGFGESPYQCLSTYAGNHLLISIDSLINDGLLEEHEAKAIPEFPQNRVDFNKVKKTKNRLFKKAYKKFKKSLPGNEYDQFCRENKMWLEDYALFMSLKEHFNEKQWNQWEEGAAFRKSNIMEEYRHLLADNIGYHKFLQFKFFNQWYKLKNYANDKGTQIIGDLPIFVSHDSSDVWKNPELFELDEYGNPTKIAGVPPDYFSETGQLWGNPLYKWERMEKDDYQWWKERFKHLHKMVDCIRIDHFRGFEAYWEVPACEETAIRGRWIKGPGEKIFNCIKREIGELPLIAEDLGFITPEVEELKIKLGLPGMTIMQFSMEHNSNTFYVPLYNKKTVAYTGTHDNDTILGWHAKNKKTVGKKEKDTICWKYIESLFHSDAETVIVPLQDILSLGSKARMNTPGTVGGNWSWRFLPGQLSKNIEKALKKLTSAYNR